MAKFDPGLANLKELDVVYPVGPRQRFGCFRTRGREVGSQHIYQQLRTNDVSPVFVDNDGIERYFLPDEITVQFRPTIPKSKQKKIIKDQGCRIGTEQFTPGYYTIITPKNIDTFDVIKMFNGLREVSFCEPSSACFDPFFHYPSDPDFGLQWALDNTGQTEGTPGADVGAVLAWDIKRGDPEVVIAIIDTGVDLDHPDLQANILGQPPGEDWDFADPDLIPEPGPENWADHGTHCAGIAAAVENGAGIVGMAPQCSILPIRIDLNAWMNQNRADAINFVTSIKGRFKQLVISCSWHTGGYTAAVANAIINADNSGILVCFAVGNDRQDIGIYPVYPGGMPEVVSVASTDHDDRLSVFSNWGGPVDVCAPGSNIYSTVIDGYGYKSGTSMSTPLVAGLAGLIWSFDPTLTKGQVRAALINGCTNIDGINSSYTGKLGSGRVNAYDSLRYLVVEPPEFILKYFAVEDPSFTTLEDYVERDLNRAQVAAGDINASLWLGWSGDPGGLVLGILDKS